MKFKVNRTSAWNEEQSSKPCEGAVWDSYIDVDIRYVSDPSKLKYKDAEKEWFENGKNHRVEDNKIKRDFERCGWTINFDTLEDIVAFSKQYGSIIISDDCNNYSIEIYDDYRE